MSFEFALVISRPRYSNSNDAMRVKPPVQVIEKIDDFLSDFDKWRGRTLAERINAYARLTAGRPGEAEILRSVGVAKAALFDVVAHFDTS